MAIGTYTNTANVLALTKKPSVRLLTQSPQPKHDAE
jgi:hypothetical protein